jgi:hypothetical protein
MSYLRRSPTRSVDGVRESLAGGEVRDTAQQPGKADLSDWVELMEAVEALCPVWPEAARRTEGDYRL